MNGTMSCSILYASMVVYEDTRSFTCDTNYVLFGGDTRTCQSDGSWSGIEVICAKSVSMYILYVINMFVHLSQEIYKYDKQLVLPYSGLLSRGKFSRIGLIYRTQGILTKGKFDEFTIFQY